MRKNKLDFIVAGVQKSATTWLHECLQEHPEILLPRKREILYFGGEKFQEKGGEEWFFSRYKSKTLAKIVGDTSVEYIYDTSVHKLLYQHNPNLKIVISLRNPVERFISAYFWYVRNLIIEDVSLEQAIEMAIKYTSSNNSCANNFKDLLTRGFYDEQLCSISQYFPSQNIFIVFYDDIKSNPLITLKKIYKFLGATPDFIPTSFKRKPKQSISSFVIKMEQKVNKYFGKTAFKIINKLLERVNKDSSYESVIRKNFLSFKKLFSVYEEHIENLEKILKMIPDENFSSNRNIRNLWNLPKS